MLMRAVRAIARSGTIVQDFRDEGDMVTINERVTELRTLMANFAVRPLDPASSQDGLLYFPFHRADGNVRGWDAIADLKNTIVLSPEKETCQIFSGFQGTGKSTELRRLTSELQRRGYLVLFVEGGKYINLHQPLEITDLLLAVTVAIAEALQEKLETDALRISLREHLASFFARIQLTQLDIGLSASANLGDATKVNVDVAKVRLELKENPSFKQRVQDYLRGTLTTFVDAFRSFMAEARRLLNVDASVCPVLIIDDLEKIQGSGNHEEPVKQSIEQIFTLFHEKLKIPNWHTIWASPPYLPVLNNSISSLYDGYFILPMVRLWQESDPSRERSREGFAALRQFLRLRGHVDGLVENEGLLDELILVSSGHVRDLCRLMQDVLRRVIALEDPRGKLNQQAIEQIVGEYVARRQLAIYTEDHAFLRTVGVTRRIEAKTGVDVHRIAKLIDTQLVMIYRNGRPWFDIAVPVQRLLATRYPSTLSFPPSPSGPVGTTSDLLPATSKA